MKDAWQDFQIVLIVAIAAWVIPAAIVVGVAFGIKMAHLLGVS